MRTPPDQTQKIDIFALGVIFFELCCPLSTEMERFKVQLLTTKAPTNDGFVLSLEGWKRDFVHTFQTCMHTLYSICSYLVINALLLLQVLTNLREQKAPQKFTDNFPIEVGTTHLPLDMMIYTLYTSP